MKKLFVAIFAILYFSHSFGQKVAPIIVNGKAKLIATWNSKTSKKAIKNLLDNGDTLIMKLWQTVYIAVKHGKEETEIERISELNEEGGLHSDSTVIEVYEYDFGDNGEKEIIVAYCSVFSLLHAQVFRQSGSLVKLIGNFSGQFEINLNKNIISFPIGSQGISNDYLYKDGAFFQLAYHDPNKK
ncbi:MAG TPA: hypothetical protein VK783_14715 [Bacteroidia bacterium]|nr:hypothetical protein [Bacteroidia bacterium]